MRSLLGLGAAVLCLFPTVVTPAQAKDGGRVGQHYVRPYTTKSGVVVQGHYATQPNATRQDNWSTIGNINPHTGKAGTKPGDTPRLRIY